MSYKHFQGLLSVSSALGARSRATDVRGSSVEKFMFKPPKVPDILRFDEESFIRKIDLPQRGFVYGHRVGARYASPWFTLNSRKPLTPDIVYKAIEHLNKKSDVFQITIREKDGELWWYKPKYMDADFQVVPTGTDIFDVIDSVWYGGFDDVNGPCWKVRFMAADENEPCPVPEVKKEFPYQYYLTTCLSHAVCDGFSVAMQCQGIVDMLNSVIEGEDIDDNVPFGAFVSNEESEAAEQMFREKLLKDPARFEELKAEVLKGDKDPLILRIFPRPQVDHVTTKHKAFHIPKDVLAKFVEQCKKNGVTFGTAFQGASNAALIELAQESGATDESFDISVNLVANLRRYMQKRDYPIFGLHARTITSLVTMGKNVQEEFWDSCRKIQNINTDLVTSGAAVEQNVIREMVCKTLPPEELFKSFPPVIRDFGYSNLGNFDRVVPGLGKHVQLSGLDQYSSIHRFIYPFFQQTFTFRGNFVYAISYATNWLTEEHATMIASRFIDVITRYSEDSNTRNKL